MSPQAARRRRGAGWRDTGHAARAGPKGGRRERHPPRRIVQAIFYVVGTGRAWRQLPKDFAPWPTVWLVLHLVARRRHCRAHPQHPARQGPRSGRPLCGAERLG
ncbi:transposase [Streptomyces sp. NPDC059247]|uniref:transposase n=1 Tax=Streptomyces sp. NPDC059247 TaxID=3346790 RepID=UPI0036C5F0E8